jgi:hypothetical protein
MEILEMRSAMKRPALLAFAVILALASCKKEADDPVVPPPPDTNESELITTVRLTYYTISFAEYKYMTFTDLDGDGGNAPVIVADTLSADSIYTVEVEVLNESASPEVNLTPEILTEGVDHQFFLQQDPDLLLLNYGDSDGNGQPIGQLFTCVVITPGSGTLKLTLRHQPDKSAPGVSAGDITNAGGDTDIEVVFPLVVD